MSKENNDALEKLEKIAELAEIGLSIDGSHHKQYALFQILKIANVQEAEAFKKYNGDIGIPG